MSTINLGNQEIWTKYGQNRTTEEFNKLLHNIIKPGIYKGGELSIYSSEVANIAPFDCLINTPNKQAVHIKTNTSVQLSFSESTPYLGASFEWLNQSNNYLDFEALTSSGIASNRIIFGKADYISGVCTGFSYDDKTSGYLDESFNVISSGTLYFGNTKNTFISKKTENNLYTPNNFRIEGNFGLGDEMDSDSFTSESYIIEDQTTNNTPLTLFNFTPNEGKTYLVEAKIGGKRTGGSAGTEGDSAFYIRKKAFYINSGVISPINITTTNDFVAESDSAWNCDINSGSNLSVFVLGASNVNINWKGLVTITKI